MYCQGLGMAVRLFPRKHPRLLITVAFASLSLHNVIILTALRFQFVRVLNRSATPCLGLEVFEVSNPGRCCTHGSTVFAPVVRGEDPDREAALRAASGHPADRGEDRQGQVHREPRAEALPVVRVQRERVVPTLPAETAEDRAVDLRPVLLGAGRAEESRAASARAQETTSHGFGPAALLGA